MSNEQRIVIVSPGSTPGADTKFGLTDGTGSGVMLSENEGVSRFSVTANPGQLHELVDLGYRLEIHRMGPNEFSLGLVDTLDERCGQPADLDDYLEEEDLDDFEDDYDPFEDDFII